ncbi:hypothetical protein GBA52_016015 [Prunus armeniaca]|nr:hypothetical protein GBA52_016015 [Prunus armeniaca]
MAMSKGELIPEINMESVQTVTPLRITEPRQARQVLTADPVGSGIFRHCLHILLYHAKASQDDARWFHVGWLKESLARALLEQPILAGRFREGDELMEIVSNDSGIRLLETRIPTSLSEFLDFRGSRGRKDAEAELVFWKDIDEQNPQYSPLVYVQVTNFQCGGCSIGISCSLLLADILLKENFIKKWADIHNNMLSKDDLPAAPMYYFPNTKKCTDSSPTSIFSSNTSKKSSQTMIFTIPGEHVNSENDYALQFCVEEAERKFGTKMASKWSLFLKTKSCNSIKVENFPKDGLIKPKSGLQSQIAAAIWDDFGTNDVEFRKGKKPALVSYWIGFVSGGLVMAMPSADQKGCPDEVKVIVTVPYQDEF